MATPLADFCSYTVGGRVHRETRGAPETIRFTPQFSMTRDPRGHYAVEHAYVQFFVPEPRNTAPPVVLVHGGGLTGTIWERTPDGRPGWLHGLLARGYEVHVIDNVERGRAGFAPGLWPGDPVLRTMEEAWELFRIGAPEDFARRRPFPGARFPVARLEDFARHFVPRWFSTTHLQVAALHALLDRLGQAIVICHSQGSDALYGALGAGAGVSGVIAIEPSADPVSADDLGDTPFVLVAGDYLDRSGLWTHRIAAWPTLVDALPRAAYLTSRSGLAPGHSHQPMCDRGSDTALAAALDTFARL
ncbi:alpha/beta fold hydrolase [Roseovarius sp. SCSIO 43702]|uniref:alpha/beta fold hydrolase n=1 Tax=Roseovarius sp. SCSIO 43702 TaxID=2823043 RepID=UPI001C736A96|nr:alpha/beta fold hydrolase [Roseovarius sp. SCSIO 43702]QYX58416.1 alpha/beta fold hydrolase [Roseovarius sp. SCSIO 43702]